MVSEQARTIGHKLRATRLERHMSQEEVADELGVPRRSYVAYEGGKNLPRPKRLRQLLAYLKQHGHE